MRCAVIPPDAALREQGATVYRPWRQRVAAWTVVLVCVLYGGQALHHARAGAGAAAVLGLVQVGLALVASLAVAAYARAGVSVGPAGVQVRGMVRNVVIPLESITALERKRIVSWPYSLARRHPVVVAGNQRVLVAAVRSGELFQGGGPGDLESFITDVATRTHRATPVPRSTPVRYTFATPQGRTAPVRIAWRCPSWHIGAVLALWVLAAGVALLP